MARYSSVATAVAGIGWTIQPRPIDPTPTVTIPARYNRADQANERNGGKTVEF